MEKKKSIPALLLAGFSSLALGVLISCGGEDSGSDEGRAVVLRRNTEPFVYQGLPQPAREWDGDVPEDDLSREPEGVCVIDGYYYHYFFEKINELLSSSAEMVELVGASSVATCADAHRAVAAKRYLSTRTSLFAESPVGSPDGAPEPLTEDLEAGQYAIWKGNTVSGTHDQNIVEIDLSSGSGDNGTCTGLVINERWILTSAHCLADSLPYAKDAGTCSGCLTAYWWNPSTGARECITDSVPGNPSCITPRTVWLRKHNLYLGGADVANDIGLVYYSSGWNRSISEARIYTGTPSTSWRRPRFGRGQNSMCGGGSGVKRYGWFDVDQVYPYHTVTYADSDYRTCDGDSGGAAELWSGSFYLYYDLQSRSIRLATCSPYVFTDCASWGGVNQEATRISPHVDWIRTYTGLDCDSHTDHGHPFVRCDD